MKAFLVQYNHVVDIALDRMSLMTIEKKEIESVRPTSVLSSLGASLPRQYQVLSLELDHSNQTCLQR